MPPSWFKPRILPRLLVWALLVAGTILATSGRAGEFQVLHWGGNDDPLNYEFAGISRSKDGYLWFGTRLKGLIRFDGVHFADIHDLRGPALLAGETRNVFVDSKGLLWISVDHHLFRWVQGAATLEWHNDTQQVDSLLDDQRLIFRLHSGDLLCAVPGGNGSRRWEIISPPQFARKSQYCLDRAKSIWYIRKDGRLGRVSGHRFDQIPLEPTLEGKNVRVLAAAPDGQIWVGTERELAIWDGSKLSKRTPENGEPLLNVTRLVFSGGGAFWVEANNRLRRWEGGRWVAEAKFEAPSGVPPSSVTPDGAQGGLWTNGENDDQLLHVSRDGVVKTLTMQMRLSGNLLKFLFNDDHGNLWAGYSRTGLMRIRPTFFETIGESEGLTDSWITSVAEDKDGALWMGTRNSGIAKWQNGQCTNFKETEYGGYGLEPVVCADALGTRIWVGTSTQGIGVFENGRSRHVVPRGRMEQARVGAIRYLLASKGGQIFLGTLDSVFCYDREKDTLTEVFRTKSGSHESPSGMAEEGGGRLWIATTSGSLLSYSHGKLTRYSPKDETYHFLSVLAESNGTVWIGSKLTGLLLFRNGEFTRLSTTTEAPFERIGSICKDREGNLWLGTEVGVVHVPKAAIKPILEGQRSDYSFRVFDKNDGMSIETTRADYQPASWCGRDGRVWFATYKGVCGCNPTAIPPEGLPPAPWIEAVQVDEKWLDSRVIHNKQTEAESLKESRRSPPNAPVALEMGPGLGELQFNYTGFNDTAPDSTLFRYRMETSDADWVNAGKERVARYRHLAPGPYVFRVQARKLGGAWSEPGASIGFRVLPYYWETLWFQIGVPGIAASLLLAGMIWALQKSHRRKVGDLQRERAVERERVRIARDIHDEIGAGLTHMAMLSELAQSSPQNSGEKHLDGIFQTSKDLVRSLDEIVWSINPAHDTLEHLVSYLVEHAERFLGAASVACRLNVPPLLPPLPVGATLRHHFCLAVKETLNNTIKHACASEVRLSIVWEAPILRVCIEDNGHGFVREQVQGSATGRDGLSNLEDRMREVGGAFEQTSSPGKGTRTVLSVDLPSAKEFRPR